MTNQRHRRRGITPRDWIIVGLVAAVAIALAAVLMWGDSADHHTAAPGTGRSTTVESRTLPTTPSERSTDGDERSTGDAGAGGDTDPGGDAGSAGLPDSIVDTMVQPGGVDESNDADSESADRIGPLGDLSRRIPDDPFALGDVDAPVVMVSFEDYRCPFCGQFARDTLPQLLEEYIDTGVLRYEWRDLPIFGPESTEAAIAGRAAAQQGKFWEFNSAIYADAPRSGHADMTQDDLVAYAKQVGVADLDAFTADLDDPELAAAVDEDVEQGSFLGVPSTPSFVIDGYPIIGAQPYQQFAELIDTVQTL